MKRAPAPRRSTAARAANGVALSLVRAYQWFVSPFLGCNCRFIPTCSQYAAQALCDHGPAKGSLLAVKRMLRCHPFGASGYDPVPPCTCRSLSNQP